MPEEKAPEGRFLPATRWGKQFNSIINAEVDPITGASWNHVLMAREDAARPGLSEGDYVNLRNELGEYRRRVKIDQAKPGSLQAHGPEINGLLPAGRLHPKGVPDYNTTVEVVAAHAPVKVEETRTVSA